MARTMTARGRGTSILLGTVVAVFLAVGVSPGIAAATPLSSGTPAMLPAQTTPDPAPTPTPDPTPVIGPTSSPAVAPVPAPVADPTTAGVVTTPVPVPVPPIPNPAQLLVQQQRAQAAAAKLAAQQQAAQQKAAARLAVASQRAHATWIAHGRPNKMIIVRRLSVDVMSGEQLASHTLRPAGDLTMAGLAALVGPQWLSVTDTDARLSAALVLSSGVTLAVGPSIRTLALTGGVTSPEAAAIYTGGGRLVLTGVRVTSSDATTRAVLPPTLGRPFIMVSSGGRLEATDATISDLGTPVENHGRAGVLFNPGSGGWLVRTALLRNSIGLKLEGSRDVRLQGVTVGQSTSDGVVLRGDRGTTMTDVKAEGNGGNGVQVTGTSTDRPITALSATGNHAYGLVVVGQSKPRITGVVTARNGAGGLELNRSSDVTLEDFRATEEPVGVYTHVGAARIAVNRLTVEGGRHGVVVEKTTTGFTMAASTIEGTQLGVSIGAHDVELRDVTIRNSTTGVSVQRGAATVSATRLTLSGGKDGFVANPGTTGVRLRDFTTDGVSNNAVRILSPNATITAGRISGATTGIDLEAPAAISDVAITRVSTGIRARSAGQIRAEQVDIAAVAIGIDVSAGTPLRLVSSRVHALESIRGVVIPEGVNDLSLPPLSVLGAIGVPLVLLAIALEALYLLRQRFFGGAGHAVRRRLPPPALPAGAR